MSNNRAALTKIKCSCRDHTGSDVFVGALSFAAMLQYTVKRTHSTSDKRISIGKSKWCVRTDGVTYFLAMSATAATPNPICTSNFVVLVTTILVLQLYGAIFQLRALADRGPFIQE